MSFMFRTSYLGFHTLESYSTVHVKTQIKTIICFMYRVTTCLSTENSLSTAVELPNSRGVLSWQHIRRIGSNMIWQKIDQTLDESLCQRLSGHQYREPIRWHSSQFQWINGRRSKWHPHQSSALDY